MILFFCCKEQTRQIREIVTKNDLFTSQLQIMVDHMNKCLRLSNAFIFLIKGQNIFHKITIDFMDWGEIDQFEIWF